jgi:hypothetical protein
MELLQLIDVRVEEASRPLREEVATLKLLLARAGDSVEPTEECTSGGLGVAPKRASIPLESTLQNSSVVEEDHLYGCISPRGSPCQSPQPKVSPTFESEGIDGISAPVLQITPELHELCGESSVVLPLELVSFEALVPSPPLLPASLVSGGVLAHSSEAVFAKELCGLLASLEAASPGYGKDIACVLAGKASEEIIKKVENSLRKVSIWGKRRKKGVARKTLAVS